MKLYVYLIRGWYREIGHWGQFLEILKENLLSLNTWNSVEIIPLELPGVGKKNSDPPPLRMDSYVKLLKKEYRDEKNTQSILIGMSFGGMIAAHLAVDPVIQHKLNGLILINTSFKNLTPFYQRLRPTNYPFIFSILCARSKKEKEKKILQLTTSLPIDEKNLNHKTSLSHKHPIRWITPIFQLFTASQAQIDLKTLFSSPLPILLLVSEKDKLVDPQCSYALHKALPTSHLKTHPKAGHDLTYDDPNWVSWQISQWLQQVFTFK